MEFDYLSMQFKSAPSEAYGFIEDVIKQLRVNKNGNFILDLEDTIRENSRTVVLEDKLRHTRLVSFHVNGDDVLFEMTLPCSLKGRCLSVQAHEYDYVLDTSDYNGLILMTQPLHLVVPCDTRVIADAVIH